MFPLYEAWGTWNEFEIHDTKTSQEGSTYVEQEIEKERIEKEEIWTVEEMEIEEKDYGKGSREQGV